MKVIVIFIASVLITAGCCHLAKSPGQAVASENNFENGVKQYEKGHIKQAIHEFEKTIEKDPANYKAYYYLGLCYKIDGIFGIALTFLQKAIDLNPLDQTWVAKVKSEMESIPKEEKGKGKEK